MDSRFLDALRGRNQGRPPVWLMRQAGRFLPEYQAMRASYSLRELFFTPELAARVTMMPVERFGVDAAILFSDITAIAPAMGLQLSFDEGPILEPWMEPKDLGRQVQLDALEPIFETVRLVKRAASVPLIGFCGGPFTVASYLIEKHNGVAMAKTMAWMKNDPGSFTKLLDQIAELSIAYLQKQIEAGADAVQIFDSWANVLDAEQRSRYSTAYIKRMAAALSRPVIVFMRGSGGNAEELSETGVAAVSVDEGRDLREIRKNVSCALQGNLNPDLLFESVETVRRTTRALLEQMRGDPGFIVNLGHGVKVGTPVASVAALVDTVKGFS